MKKILLVEDEPAIVEGLKTLLLAEHFEIETAGDGEAGLSLALSFKPDMILLDIMLPKLNGLNLLQKLRNEERMTIPVIMLTSRKEEIDKIMGLEFGADDYITKPFSARELVARVKAVLRRSEGAAVSGSTVKFGDISVDLKHQEVRKNGTVLHLSVTEYKMLIFFIRHANEVVSREKLLDDVWGYDAYPTTRTVDNFILSLRKHIEVNPSEPEHLLTVHRAGYRFRLNHSV